MSESTHARYRAAVEYDGTNYLGFQRQRSDQSTIQGELEQALRRIAGAHVTVYGSGRTDSGVHATGQVIAFDLNWRHGCQKLLKALNANLPGDIVLRDVERAPSGFHPRFDAKQRTYQYVIEDCSRSARRPLTRLRHWQIEQPLDIGKMNEAASHLVGVHDFATFGRPPQGSNSVREVFGAFWQEEGERLVFTIEANAFLYRMVRSIVGTLKLVGDGGWSVEKFLETFRSKDRSRAGTSAPPHGLYLTSVTY